MKDKSPAFNWRMILPNYWLLWTLILLWRLVICLPFRLQIILGRRIGRIFYTLASKRRHITKVNIKLCFPELTKAEQNELVKQTFENMGIGLMETGMSWWASEKRRKKLQETIEGLEHIQNAQKENKAVLLVGAHFSSLDLGIILLSQYAQIFAIYRAHKNSVFDWVMYKGRSKHVTMIERHEMHEVIRRLRQRKIIWYAPDQDYGAKYSVYAPFFGQPAATITATARLAKADYVTVLPFKHHRINGKYHITIGEPLENYPSGNAQQDAARINSLIETAIREHPAQYLWQHRRFKTQEQGKQARPY